MLGLRFCARAFSSCGKRGPLFIAVRGPLTVAASPVAEHKLQTRRLSSCGPRVQLLCGMWDPPRPGLEPVSPALAGRLLTTAPPGKPSSFFYDWIIFNCMAISTLFTHSSIDGHLFCFHLLAIVNSASVNIRVQVFVWIPLFIFFFVESQWICWVIW